MSVNKEELRKKFSKEWKKHYKVDALTSKGYARKQCSSCGRYFWALEERETCADSCCAGHEFIGHGAKKMGYVETWKAIERFFEKRGHKSIKRYPTVCRWRDDLYFTNASIIDFQPYVVSGEIEPPANPLVVPQPSIRFGDIGNVGVTGEHYTSFIMFGQHAFNSKKTGLFYWKNEALEHDFEYVQKVLGAKKEDIVFQEEVWAGGGSFGPCMEYCVKGVELGNCVFMQFKELGNGRYEELKTKVIDMGAGLERLAWFTNGTATSYEVTFGAVVKKIMQKSGVTVDRKLFSEYARLSGKLNELKDYRKGLKEIAERMGVEEMKLRNEIAPVQAVFAVADHLKTILYTATDGMLPSNSGGGYNLRMLLRRVFGFNHEYNFNLDFGQIIEGHAAHLKKLDEDLMEGVELSKELVREEEKKYRDTLGKAGKKVTALIEKKGKGRRIEEGELRKLYESDGIAPETVKELGKKKGIEVEIPKDFYEKLAQKDETGKTAVQEVDLSRFKPTKQLFYEHPFQKEFTAKVLGIKGNKVVLDKTLFYAEAGGQASDKGELNGIKVSDVQKEGPVTYHVVAFPGKFKKGQKVKGAIGFERRMNLTRNHTGAHVLNAAARMVLGNHIWQAGSFKEEEKAHLDVTHYRRITLEELKKIELQANKIILENVPVISKFMDRGEAEQKYGFRLYQGGAVPGKVLRVVNIKGYDVEACGGTHVTSTSQIGAFKILKRESIKDGIERIVYTTGLGAIKEVHEKERLLKESAEKLGVPQQKLVESASRFFTEWKDQRKYIQRMHKQLIGMLSEKLLSQAKENKVKVYLPQGSLEMLLELAKRIVESNESLTVMVGAGKDFTIMAGKKSGVKANELLKELLSKVRGQGGGSERLARGRAENENELKKYLTG